MTLIAAAADDALAAAVADRLRARDRPVRMLRPDDLPSALAFTVDVDDGGATAWIFGPDGEGRTVGAVLDRLPRPWPAPPPESDGEWTRAEMVAAWVALIGATPKTIGGPAPDAWARPALLDRRVRQATARCGLESAPALLTSHSDAAMTFLARYGEVLAMAPVGGGRSQRVTTAESLRTHIENDAPALLVAVPGGHCVSIVDTIAIAGEGLETSELTDRCTALSAALDAPFASVSLHVDDAGRARLVDVDPQPDVDRHHIDAVANRIARWLEAGHAPPSVSQFDGS